MGRKVFGSLGAFRDLEGRSVTSLFPPSIDEKVACIEREVRYRERVYPRLVWAKKMSQQKADREIEVMAAILEDLKEKQHGA